MEIDREKTPSVFSLGLFNSNFFGFDIQFLLKKTRSRSFSEFLIDLSRAALPSSRCNPGSEG